MNYVNSSTRDLPIIVIQTHLQHKLHDIDYHQTKQSQLSQLCGELAIPIKNTMQRAFLTLMLCQQMCQ